MAFDLLDLNRRVGGAIERASAPVGLQASASRLRVFMDVRIRRRAFDRLCARWDTRVVRFCGLRRSGNHAVIAWLAAQMAGPVAWLNDVSPGSLGPRASRPKPLEVYRARHRAAPGWLLYGYEDVAPTAAFATPRWHEHAVWGGTAEVFDVMILRDPLNLFASRLRWRGGALLRDAADRARVVALWKAHAREALGDTREGRHTPLTVLFDRWFADQAYRRDLSARLGLRFSDRGLQRVSHHGSGSSFDGQSFHGAAQQMRVLDRWRALVDEPAFRAMVDDEVRALAARLFGRELPCFSDSVTR